jgi:hypothetical protein
MDERETVREVPKENDRESLRDLCAGLREYSL